MGGDLEKGSTTVWLGLFPEFQGTIYTLTSLVSGRHRGVTGFPRREHPTGRVRTGQAQNYRT